MPQNPAEAAILVVIDDAFLDYLGYRLAVIGPVSFTCLTIWIAATNGFYRAEIALEYEFDNAVDFPAAWNLLPWTRRRID